ncbi:hypothetical protein LX36DRAFT_275289 [Colletotrichum falcatum]|nr:hypothetical protein LX36DRAFT_275289 [Colletotrichum falcatum]
MPLVLFFLIHPPTYLHQIRAFLAFFFFSKQPFSSPKARHRGNSWSASCPAATGIASSFSSFPCCLSFFPHTPPRLQAPCLIF